ncbi:MAG: hypothetical protein GY754_32830 [bacterium]|nr:hypothetical protein [bacterium]
MKLRIKQYSITLTLVFTFLLIFEIASLARCGGGGDTNPRRRQQWLPIGINIGTSEGTGFHIGGEISFVYLDRKFWRGFYADGLYSDGDPRFSVGPEIGYSILGFDCGFAGGRINDELFYGFTARVVLTAGSVVSIYARYNWVTKQENHLEGGVLLKFPFRM